MFSTKQETNKLLADVTLAIVKDCASVEVLEYLKVNGVPTCCKIVGEMVHHQKFVSMKYTVTPVTTRSWIAMGHDISPVYETESMTNIYSFIFDRLYLICG